MKHILVPTDFSECATHALDFAINIALHIEAKIHLYHCCNLSWDLAHQPKYIESSCISELEQIKHTEWYFEAIKKTYPMMDFEISYSGGDLIDNINFYIQTKGIDLVILGTHGRSGLNKSMLGSNAQRIIRKVSCSVLTIKHPYDKVDFKNVIYASTFEDKELEAFKIFKAFLKHFIPTFHLVYILKDGLFHPSLEDVKRLTSQFEKYCKPLNCKVHILKNDSVERGINYISTKVDADLIALSNHYRHPLKRTIIGSTVEKLANLSDIPILSIDYDEVENQAINSKEPFNTLIQ